MEDFKESCISGIKRRYSRLVSGCKVWSMAFVVALLAGCTPLLYSVDMKYVPTGTFSKTPGVAKPIVVTVATFQDSRTIEDRMLIGRVIKAGGKQLPVLPKYVKPSNAVTAPVKEFFRLAGYRVATESPAWDLQESSINKGWGPILVGGSIDELDITCQNSLAITKYTAKVKLTIYFADTLKGKIFHKVTTDSRVSLDHVLFSEERMEQQINAALSDAIEKMFEGRDVANIIGGI